MKTILQEFRIRLPQFLAIGMMLIGNTTFAQQKSHLFNFNVGHGNMTRAAKYINGSSSNDPNERDLFTQVALTHGVEFSAAYQYIPSRSSLFEIRYKFNQDRLSGALIDENYDTVLALSDLEMNSDRIIRNSIDVGYGYIFNIGEKHDVIVKLNVGRMFLNIDSTRVSRFENIPSAAFPIDSNGSFSLAEEPQFSYFSPSLNYYIDLGKNAIRLGLYAEYFQAFGDVFFVSLESRSLDGRSSGRTFGGFKYDSFNYGISFNIGL